MGRFCLLAYTGLTDRLDTRAGFLEVSKSSQANPIRKKQRVDFGKLFVWWRTKAIFQTKMWEVLLTNERKSKEKSKTFARRRHWWLV